MMISILCCTFPLPSNEWIKAAMPVFAAILSFLLALLILPLIRARNEQKRLSSLKEVVDLWLNFFNSKIELQTANLENFIIQLKENQNPVSFPFEVVDIQIDHFLN